ncbi:MAG: UDP-N-acetylmuramate dehydrogenase [Candidatus Moranbacteria bacterium]|nr:UDP-N-acetylmuramate dehydrogenase [Candidatus Moranbacteria bacterium]
MISIQENISLKKYTTFNIGGKARYFVLVKSIEDLKEALKFAEEKELKYFILAGGSNVLFSDLGFSGLVIKIDLKEIEINYLKITAGAGVMLSYLIKFSAENNLTGIEKLFGIPGTVGGAVRGNAGAFGVEIIDVITQIKALNIKTGEIKTLSKEECELKYRSSLFKKNKNWIILEATFELKIGNQGELKKSMKEIMQKRNNLQLQSVKTAGSFFTNPVANEKVQKMFEEEKNTKCRESRVPTGWLLDKVGLKGERIGDIKISENQANYFLNLGDGTFDQVLQLSSMAKSRVRDEFNIQLTEEVEIVY